MISTTTPDFANDLMTPPLEWHRQMREWSRVMRDTQPVSYNEENKCWRVFRYDDVARVMNDYATFSSEHRTPGQERPSSIISMDPPRHRQLRSLVTVAFSARTIAQMAPRIAEITRDLLVAPLERGEMDFVSEFAAPLPVKVIAAMLGIPLDDWQSIRDWSSAVLADQAPDSAPTVQEEMLQQRMLASGEMYQYFAQIIAERRQHPGQDLISLLLAAEVDGQHLNEAELFGFCVTLLVAGNITTTQLLGNALLCFDEHPKAWQQLLQDRSLIASAVEEILRYLPPNKGIPGNKAILDGRTATVDVILGGQHIHAGEKVSGSGVSANFDERHFPDPERFDIQRSPNRHLSFGHGIHFCIGAPLARLEAKVALETLLEMMPKWSIRRDVPLELIPSSMIFGVKRLPIVLG